jgi:hypothetical protein
VGLLLVGVELPQWFRMVSSEQILERAVVRLPKDIFIRNAPEKYFANMLASYPFNLSNEKRTSIRRRNNIFRMIRYFNFDVIPQSQPINYLTDRQSFEVLSIWIESKLNLTNVGNRLAVVMNGKTPGLSEIVRDGKSLFLNGALLSFLFPKKAPAYKIGSFGSFGGSVNTIHSESADHDQTEGKVRDGNVPDLRLTKKLFPPSFRVPAIIAINLGRIWFLSIGLGEVKGKGKIVGGIFAFLGIGGLLAVCEALILELNLL